MSFFKEFKEFAMRGNMIDLAVGIIIGAAFNEIVSSLVEDILMPILGLLIGGIDFKDFAFVLKAATATEPAVTVNYGVFIQYSINFVIVAFAVFLLIKGINKLHTKKDEEEKAPPATPEDILLLAEIRDLLKEDKS